MISPFYCRPSGGSSHPYIPLPPDDSSASGMSALGILCDWRLSDADPAAMAASVDSLAADLKAKYDRVGAAAGADFDGVVGALIELEREHATLESPLDFAQHCATSKVGAAVSPKNSKLFF